MFVFHPIGGGTCGWKVLSIRGILSVACRRLDTKQSAAPVSAKVQENIHISALEKWHQFAYDTANMFLKKSSYQRNALYVKSL